MPTPTPTVNIWRYQLNLSRSGQKAIIGITLRNVGSPGSPDYFNFCQSILTAQEALGGLHSKTKGMLVSEWSIDSHQLQAIFPTRLVPLIRQPGGSPTAGTRTGVALPINTQSAIARKTAVATRYGQSIVKPPFGSALDTSDKAYWDTAFITDANDWATRSMADFVGTIPADVLRPVLWSSGPVADALEFRTAVVGPTLRVIRRRTVGVGV